MICLSGSAVVATEGAHRAAGNGARKVAGGIGARLGKRPRHPAVAAAGDAHTPPRRSSAEGHPVTRLLLRIWLTAGTALAWLLGAR